MRAMAVAVRIVEFHHLFQFDRMAAIIHVGYIRYSNIEFLTRREPAYRRSRQSSLQEASIGPVGAKRDRRSRPGRRATVRGGVLSGRAGRATDGSRQDRSGTPGAAFRA